MESENNLIQLWDRTESLYLKVDDLFEVLWSEFKPSEDFYNRLRLKAENREEFYKTILNLLDSKEKIKDTPKWKYLLLSLEKLQIEFFNKLLNERKISSVDSDYLQNNHEFSDIVYILQLALSDEDYYFSYDKSEISVSKAISTIVYDPSKISDDIIKFFFPDEFEIANSRNQILILKHKVINRIIKDFSYVDILSSRLSYTSDVLFVFDTNIGALSKSTNWAINMSVYDDLYEYYLSLDFPKTDSFNICFEILISINEHLEHMKASFDIKSIESLYVKISKIKDSINLYLTDSNYWSIVESKKVVDSLTSDETQLLSQNYPLFYKKLISFFSQDSLYLNFYSDAILNLIKEQEDNIYHFLHRLLFLEKSNMNISKIMDYYADFNNNLLNVKPFVYIRDYFQLLFGESFQYLDDSESSHKKVLKLIQFIKKIIKNNFKD